MAASAIVFSQQPQGPPPAPPGGPGEPGPGSFAPFGPGGPGGPFDGFGPGEPRGGFGPGLQGPRPGLMPFGPFGRDLNLTEDQKTELRKIGESFRDSDRALLVQMRKLHENQTIAGRIQRSRSARGRGSPRENPGRARSLTCEDDVADVQRVDRGTKGSSCGRASGDASNVPAAHTARSATAVIRLRIFGGLE